MPTSSMLRFFYFSEMNMRRFHVISLLYSTRQSLCRRGRAAFDIYDAEPALCLSSVFSCQASRRLVMSLCS